MVFGSVAARFYGWIERGVWWAFLRLDSHGANIDFPALVYIGIYAATLSSGIASLVGAPRILQAVARDDLFSLLRIFKKGRDGDDEPINAYIMTFLLASVCIAFGNSTSSRL